MGQLILWNSGIASKLCVAFSFRQPPPLSICTEHCPCHLFLISTCLFFDFHLYCTFANLNLRPTVNLGLPNPRLREERRRKTVYQNASSRKFSLNIRFSKVKREKDSYFLCCVKTSRVWTFHFSIDVFWRKFTSAVFSVIVDWVDCP